MMNNIIDPQSLLKDLGERLKRYRLARNESQELFAARLGLTRQSYSKMEKGVATVSIGHWLNASAILGKLESCQNILAEDENLFDQFGRANSKRQRAGKKRQNKK